MKLLKAIGQFMVKVLKFLFVKKSCCEYSKNCRIKDDEKESNNG